jgi:hypothetical protein
MKKRYICYIRSEVHPLECDIDGQGCFLTFGINGREKFGGLKMDTFIQAQAAILLLL